MQRVQTAACVHVHYILTVQLSYMYHTFLIVVLLLMHDSDGSEDNWSILAARLKAKYLVPLTKSDTAITIMPHWAEPWRHTVVCLCACQPVSVCCRHC